MSDMKKVLVIGEPDRTAEIVAAMRKAHSSTVYIESTPDDVEMIRGLDVDAVIIEEEMMQIRAHEETFEFENLTPIASDFDFPQREPDFHRPRGGKKQRRKQW